MLEYLLLTVITIVFLFILITLEPKPTKESNSMLLFSYLICFLILSPILIIFFIITKLLRDD